MKAAVIKTLAVATLAAFAGAAAHGQEVQRCAVYNWKPGDIIPLKATMYMHTSVTLPEESQDVLWAAKEMWETEFIKNRIFTKPLSNTEQGKETTITAVGMSGNSYEFRVVRVPRGKLASHCLIVTTSGAMVNRANWESRDSQHMAQVQALTAQIARLQADKVAADREGERKTREALKLYRAAVNSNYEWSGAEGWYAGGGSVVEAVHDDGRMTYVKLKHDNFGLMSILGEIDGKQEILEAKYEPSTRTYTINGIFPRFKMRAGNSELTISRKGA
ncbi:TrbG/VirB9 family P-type conjugative transfer protein [Eleftheria terrae]|uniref:TrbG/VirB9 family P-type conjugative transfer protein n=1 Tax=Eleftheria terrae TaxID=1597781 RepID=UPI00263BD8FE|nr:TrbG/VirB9 family P-type conjugative transfer protein [Eleftheria terrae]WKB50511.1 TrbG/VirB9 family P-type conjugative transfer protein [Eleftheria terrae]